MTQVAFYPEARLSVEVDGTVVLQAPWILTRVTDITGRHVISLPIIDCPIPSTPPGTKRHRGSFRLARRAVLVHPASNALPKFLSRYGRRPRVSTRYRGRHVLLAKRMKALQESSGT